MLLLLLKNIGLTVYLRHEEVVIVLKQSQLNSVSLKEASEMISASLISERIQLRAAKQRLDADKKRYQEDYILANDGDASENAPLEQAVQNLKTITGDMVAVQKKIQMLDRVEDSVYLNAVFDYDVLMSAVNSLSPDSTRLFLSIFGASSKDAVVDVLRAMPCDTLKGKVLEFDKYYVDGMINALKMDYEKDDPVWKSRSMLEAAVDKKLEQGVMAAEYKLLSEFEHVKSMKSVPPYNTCGVIVIYTTVRVKLEDKQFTYKIYPKGLSFIDDGIMAAEAKLAAALLGRHKGDVVSIRHGSRGTLLNYEVVDIY